MDHTSVGGAGVDDGAAAGADADMAADHDDITGVKFAEAVDPAASAGACPAAAGHVGLTHTGLVQAPVDETGAVKGIRSLGAPDIGTAELGAGDVEKRSDASAARIDVI